MGPREHARTADRGRCRCALRRLLRPHRRRCLCPSSSPPHPKEAPAVGTAPCGPVRDGSPGPHRTGILRFARAGSVADERLLPPLPPHAATPSTTPSPRRFFTSPSLCPEPFLAPSLRRHLPVALSTGGLVAAYFCLLPAEKRQSVAVFASIPSSSWPIVSRVLLETP